jgi:phospholipid/cholesterol/gamma-HCH transport system ATP-binding protein
MSADYEHVISIRGLVNRFGPQVVHDHLQLEVRRDEILGVVGGSGTGKSVLLRSILGLIKNGVSYSRAALCCPG